MSEENETAIAADSLGVNILSESVGRALEVIAGIVSGAILVRATDIAAIWTLADYAHLKVLMYWNQLFSIVILLGLTTAIVRTVSSYSHEPQKTGTVLTASLIVTTIAFTLIAIVTTLFVDQIGFLTADTLEITNELRAMWVLVLLSLLPSAYIMIGKSFFSGLQRMKRGLLIDTAYNGLRIVILLYLFLNTIISLYTVLIMYIIITLAGFAVALTLIYRDLRAEGISLSLEGFNEVIRPLFRLASTFFALALLSTFVNQITPLLVNYYGSDFDVARYSIANNLLVTIRAFLYAPYAVLLPNIAGMYSRGEHDELRKRFDDSNRILVPTIIFAFLATFMFGEFLIGGIYGVRALEQTGGLSAYQFFLIMSPNLLVFPISSIYGNVLTALGKMKALLLIGSFSVIIQALWIILLQHYIGVQAMALLWIVSFFFFFAYHYYTRKTTKLTIGKGLLVRGFLLTIIAAPIAFGFAFAAGVIGNLLHVILTPIPLLSTTTFTSFLKLAFIAPLWYIFLSLCLATGVMRLSDIDNLKKFLRKIPPVWWISKPLIGYIERIEKHRLLRSMNKETTVV
jgi:O-antigen/teichoic acid export membrane protein